MITVYSKEEFRKSFKSQRETYTETLKKQIQKKRNNKKKLGITAIAAASLAAGGLTISAAELAIIGGFSLAGSSIKRI